MAYCLGLEYKMYMVGPEQMKGSINKNEMTELLLNKLTIKTVNELWYAEEVV
jgi:hypothetical protein